MPWLQFVIAGSSSEFCANAKSPAGQQSWLFDVTPGADHSLITEQMNFPRIVSSLQPATCRHQAPMQPGGDQLLPAQMADLTILPDGRLFLCNGAAKGMCQLIWVAGLSGCSWPLPAAVLSQTRLQALLVAQAPTTPPALMALLCPRSTTPPSPSGSAGPLQQTVRALCCSGKPPVMRLSPLGCLQPKSGASITRSASSRATPR